MSDGKVVATVTVSSDPRVMGGAWCIDGTRIPVETPFQLIDRKSIYPDDVFDHFPTLAGKICWEDA